MGSFRSPQVQLFHVAGEGAYLLGPDVHVPGQPGRLIAAGRGQPLGNILRCRRRLLGRQAAGPGRRAFRSAFKGRCGSFAAQESEKAGMLAVDHAAVDQPLLLEYLEPVLLQERTQAVQIPLVDDQPGAGGKFPRQLLSQRAPVRAAAGVIDIDPVGAQVAAQEIRFFEDHPSVRPQVLGGPAAEPDQLVVQLIAGQCLPMLQGGQDQDQAPVPAPQVHQSGQTLPAFNLRQYLQKADGVLHRYRRESAVTVFPRRGRNGLLVILSDLSGLAGSSDPRSAFAL